MIDADAFAALICDWCLEASPGQSVVLATTTAGEPLAAALYRALLDREVWPHLDLRLRGQERMLLEHAATAQLDTVAAIEHAVYASMDAWVGIDAPLALHELAGVDAARQARRAIATAPLRAVRLAKRWTGTIWPTEALAQQAGMSFADYDAFLERALLLDRPDPLGAWRDLQGRQQQLVDRLAGARELRIQTARTDLRLAVGGRRWRNSDGKRNMPSGEVFTSPHETSANGHIHFDVPSITARGTVTGIDLTVRDGVVVAAHAEDGDAVLQAQLDVDAGARRFGEIGIGTNDAITRATGSTLLDEKIGGTVHLALGASYPECGGQNVSAIHWDVICDLRGGGEISVDGEPLSRDGVLL